MSEPPPDSDTGVEPERTGLPRWVWLVGIVLLLVVLLGVILMLTGVVGGEHTPGPPPGGH